MIGILYERSYWKKTPSGRLPRMRLTCFTNSDKDTFDLEKEDMSKIGFFHRNTETVFEMSHFIKLFARESLATFFPNLIMYTQDSLDGKRKPIARVDLIVRVVEWNKYHYPMKLLIQIMPSHRPYLARVADSLKIDSYDKLMAEKEKILNAWRALRKGVVRKTG